MNHIIIITLVSMLIIAALTIGYQLVLRKQRRHIRALNAALAGASAVIVDLVHQCEEQRKLLMDQQRLIEEPFTEDEIAAIRKMATDESQPADDSLPFNVTDIHKFN